MKTRRSFLASLATLAAAPLALLGLKRAAGGNPPEGPEIAEWTFNLSNGLDGGEAYKELIVTFADGRVSRSRHTFEPLTIESTPHSGPDTLFEEWSRAVARKAVESGRSLA